jgi:hypothetical protein
MAERILILFLIIILILSLSGCVSKFDNAAYIRLVDATALLSPDVCSDPKKVLHTITDFRSKIDWLVLYEGGLPNNTLTNRMLAGVAQTGASFDVDGSPLYCQLKMQAMRHTLREILNAESRKPTT